MNEEDRENEEVDVKPYEGKPDFVESPTTRTLDAGAQDAEEAPNA